MKVRIKFSKEGKMKFIGHLDLIRLFQRIMKIVGIPVAYSQGFNPHSLLYFAQALSVGITSEGEYLDVHLEKEADPKWIKKQMNHILPEGLKIEDVFVLLDGSKTCMALIDASSYVIEITKDEQSNGFMEKSRDFFNQEEILATRISKKKAKIINIKEFIYELTISEDDTKYIIDVTLATGSRKNLNAKFFIDSFSLDSKLELAYSIHRKELFSLNKEGDLKPLWKIGV